jgi:acyl-CoA oxidase
MLRMVGRMAVTAVRDKNPLTTRETSRAHLRDGRVQLAALAHREETLVRTAAARMRKRLQDGADAHAALLDVQEHMVAAALAHVDRVVAEAFRAAVPSVDDQAVRPWLERLCDLHALARIEETMAWYLEDGYVEAPKARAIRKEVEALCRELAPAARPLVDAFGIPDACLAAPIAFFDPAHPAYDAA